MKITYGTSHGGNESIAEVIADSLKTEDGQIGFKGSKRVTRLNV